MIDREKLAVLALNLEAVLEQVRSVLDDVPVMPTNPRDRLKSAQAAKLAMLDGKDLQ